MKLSPVWLAGRARGGFDQRVVHTGQHYDANMSGRFFEELGLPEPDHNLEVGAGTHAAQTAGIMLRFEPILDRIRPDWVVVYGDVNSTIATALVAVKKGVRVAHVEAGLRSRDLSMPEEINRLLTDRVADLLLTPSRDADANLMAEGVPPERIAFVGNVMVDTLLRLRPRAAALDMPGRLGLAREGYAFVTLHRPSNVDRPEVLRELLEGLEAVAAGIPVLFPMHPRTRERVASFRLGDTAPSVRMVEPLGYLETVSLVEQAAIVITDSGGLQEETTVLGVPCLTARATTERPITIREGTNRLIRSTREEIVAATAATLQQRREGSFTPRRPEGWDGRAGERVVGELALARAPRLEEASGRLMSTPPVN